MIPLSLGNILLIVMLCTTTLHGILAFHFNVLGLPDNASFSEAVHSLEKENKHYYQGAAFMVHDSDHDCDIWINNEIETMCTFYPHYGPPGVHLSVNTTLLDHWSYIELNLEYLDDNNALEGDFIGLYCVNAEWEDDNAVNDNDLSSFFDYYEIIPEKLPSNNRIVFGPLANQRCSYQFQYLRPIRSFQYQSIGISPAIEMVQGHSEPVQVHLALTDNPGEMRVMWVSGRVTQPRCTFGDSPGKRKHAVRATTTTYLAEDLCTIPSTIQHSQFYRHPGYMHNAVLKNLVSGKTYYYNVESMNGIASKEFSFTYPGDSDTVKSTSQMVQSFFVFGDNGLGVLEESDDDSDEILRHNKKRMLRLNTPILASPYDKRTVLQNIEQDLKDDLDGQYVAVVHFGDLSYAKGRTYKWDQFGTMIQPIASKLPYMVAIGNHEYDYTYNGLHHDLSGSYAAQSNGWHPLWGNYRNDSRGECGVPTVKRFQMPENGNSVFWYSFQVGLTFQIILSSEHDADRDSPMIQWFENELLSIDRHKTPWVILHLHRPLYCSENYPLDYPVSVALRIRLEPLLKKYRVDLVFAGHYHAYERTCPVLHEKCHIEEIDNSDWALAPTHIMIGSGGASVDDVTYRDTEWSINSQLEYGYGRLHIYNATHSLFEFLRTRDRIVSDTHWIRSNHNW